MNSNERILMQKLKDMEENRDAILSLSNARFVSKLINDKFFYDDKAFKLFVMEMMVEAFNTDTDWPIRYYRDNEQPDPLTKEEVGEDISDFVQESFLKDNK